jgi:hypothetical protein
MNTELQRAAQPGSTERRCLVVVLRPRLTLIKNLIWPIKGFVLDNERFEDAGFGEWTGFYDWLRNSDRTLLGVRYWVENETGFLVNYTKELPYVAANEQQIEIYFVSGSTPEPRFSADQEFLYDAVFRSVSGEYAIAFGMEELTEEDLNSLEQADVRWLHARSVEWT